MQKGEYMLIQPLRMHAGTIHLEDGAVDHSEDTQDVHDVRVLEPPQDIHLLMHTHQLKGSS
jgi:hypothetical protein